MFGGFQVGPFQLAYQQQATATVQQNSGGWERRRYFLDHYEARLKRRIDEEKRRRELELKAEEIADETAREIAQFLHEQERQDAERAEFERLRRLVAEFGAKGAEGLATRVQSAYLRAVVQGNFSAYAALDREIQRMLEEEEIAALIMLLNEDI